MKKWVVVVGCCAGLIASAQAQRPSLVPAPLELQPNPALKRFDEPLLAAFVDTLREKAGVLMPTRKEVQQAFADGKRQDCRESNACLSGLAVRAGTLYALFVELSYMENKELVVVGRVVRDDGKLMGTSTAREQKGSETIVDVSRRLFIKLYEQLGLSKLPTFKEAAVVTPPPEKKDPPPPEKKDPPPPDKQIKDPPPPLPPVDPPLNAGRVAGWVAVGVGAAAVVGGVISFASAPVIRTDPSGAIYREDAANYPTAQLQQGLGVGLMAGGAGVAAVGAVLVLLSKDEPAASTPKTTFVPLPGGGAVVVGGTF